MNEYETEEQQVEALKKWWKENSTSLIVGLFVGVSALFGWRYYVDQNHSHAIQASDLYMRVMQSTMTNTVNDQTMDINTTLVNNYSDTPYAALSSLALAKSEYEKGNVDAATAQLELAVKHANDEVTKQIASLRLASVYIEQKKYEEVSMILNMSHDVAFDAHYEELKGDLYMAKGDTDQARIAYDKAISLLGVSAGKWLKLKRQNLGSIQNEASASNGSELVT
ncbi:MAG: tetratricopeptide repeat protein [Gammaproteobacteria bacterium]|nr:tetratricopeptide repeat protein [Gammaproteobacteria bacterium]